MKTLIKTFALVFLISGNALAATDTLECRSQNESFQIRGARLEILTKGHVSRELAYHADSEAKLDGAPISEILAYSEDKMFVEQLAPIEMRTVRKLRDKCGNVGIEEAFSQDLQLLEVDGTAYLADRVRCTKRVIPGRCR